MGVKGDSQESGNGTRTPPALETEDEAHEELINSQSKTPLKTPTDTEVKLIVNESINGDAKMDIENLKSGFSGMTKEELLKYVNDPFWVRTRTVLFILFWAIWVAMFVAAIAIIVMAPRCEAPTPRKWYQEGPVYDVTPEALTDDKSLINLKNKLDYLEELNVKGLILGAIVDSDGSGSTIDYKAVNPGIGTLDELKSLLVSAKEKAIRVLLSLVPNHSSVEHPWFNKSISSEIPYDEYYVWAKGTLSADGAHQPPNNWLSLKGGSAWEWNEIRGEFFLHQFASNQPDLNFANPKVLEEFNGILTHWLDIGFSGFNIDLSQYLIEDAELKDEVGGRNPGTTHDEYDFYQHFHTYNRPEVAAILSAWRNITETKTEGDGLFVITGEVPIPTDNNGTIKVVDLARPPPILAGLKDGEPLSASNLYRELQSLVHSDRDWPAIQTGGSQGTARVADKYGQSFVDPLNFITLLLPGTPVTTFGDELGLTSAESSKFLADPDNAFVKEAKNAYRSHFNVYNTVAAVRDSPSILYGATNITLLEESNLVVTRWKAGYPGYLAVYNAGTQNSTVDLSEFTQLPSELTVFAVGSGETELQTNARVPTQAIPMSPQTAAIFTFVPKQPEE